MNSTPPGQGWMSMLIPLVVIVVVMALRWRRMSRLRPLKLEHLWIVPALYLGVTALVFWNTPPPTPLAWAACAGALALGAVLGWQRGRLMHIEVDPQTRSLRQKGSAAAMLFLVALIVIRTAAREAALLASHPLDIKAMTDGLIAFALGLLTLQRAEMFIRARRLMGQAALG